MRNRGGLNRRRSGVAHVGDGGENLLGKAEVGERRGRSLGRSRIEFGDVGGSQNGPFPRGKRQQRHPTWVRSPNRPRCGVDMHKWCAGRSARWSVFANGIDASTWSRFHRRKVYGLQMRNLGTGANYTSAQQAYSSHWHSAAAKPPGKMTTAACRMRDLAACAICTRPQTHIPNAHSRHGHPWGVGYTETR